MGLTPVVVNHTTVCRWSETLIFFHRRLHPEKTTVEAATAIKATREMADKEVPADSTKDQTPPARQLRSAKWDLIWGHPSLRPCMGQ